MSWLFADEDANDEQQTRNDQTRQREQDEVPANAHHEPDPLGDLPQDERDEWHDDDGGNDQKRSDLGIYFEPLSQCSIGRDPPLEAEQRMTNDFGRALNSAEMARIGVHLGWFDRFRLPVTTDELLHS